MNENLASKRLLYLDSARGLAAFSVMTFHFFFAVNGMQIKKHYGDLSHIFWYAEASVIFFFIHSGFILAYSYAGEGKKLTIGYYLRFLIERIFRIYPLFLLILLISFFTINNTPPYNHLGSEGYVELFWQDKLSWLNFFKQSILVVRIPDSANLRLIPQDWTVTIELIAGASIPLLAFAGRKNLLIFILLLGALKASNFLTTYIFEFGLGVFLFLQRSFFINLWKKCNLLVKLLIGGAAVVLYSVFLVFPAFFSGEIVFLDSRVDRIVAAAGCLLIFIVLLSSEKIQRFLSFPFLVQMGKISYSIYLLHQLLIFVSWRLFPSFFSSLPQKAILIITLIYLSYLLITIGLSKILFKFIEHPMNVIGKKIASKIRF